MGNANEYTYRAPAQRRWRFARIFKTRPCKLKHDPLLRIHVVNDFWQQTEEFMVERIDIVDEAPPFTGGLVDVEFGITPQQAPIPTPCGHFADARPAPGEIRPVLATVVRARKTKRNADDRGIH